MAKATKLSPPYTSYLTLKNTVDTFAESTVPTRLDSHVLSNLSGASYSGLISALRFLGLIDDDKKVGDGFRALVEARRSSEENYKKSLGEVLKTSYSDIVIGVDIQSGTLPELEDAFQAAGVAQGQMTTKSVSFYIRALKDCGIAVSPHITKKRQRKKTSARATRVASGSGGKGNKSDPPPPPPPKDTEPEKGFDRLPIPGVDGGFIEYPKTLTSGQVKMYEAMVGVLREYVETTDGGES